MSHCDNCSGGCGSCARELTLTEVECRVLEKLAQIPFLPIARTIADPTPIYLEDADFSREEYSLILQLLEKKSLISLDFDRPLKNHTPSPDYPIHGSMALTARGQAVLELLELQGASE
ncbi:MAG: hypothetical protein IJW14_02960 [Oscillospiraceae bacterium]|nr:hypothetical protein [Oscillospiraceae bacterium]